VGRVVVDPPDGFRVFVVLRDVAADLSRQVGHGRESAGGHCTADASLSLQSSESLLGESRYHAVKL
jgi:hypothetical protein